MQSYVLHLKELYCRLQKHNAEEAPTDNHLWDQFLLGLEEGALLQVLKRFVCQDPEVMFMAVQQEALLPEVTCAMVGVSNGVRSCPQFTAWKQELPRGRSWKS